ncbi:MAG: hypothetical protein ACHP7O_03365 [Burkholderiales bacterium]
MTPQPWRVDIWSATGVCRKALRFSIAQMPSKISLMKDRNIAAKLQVATVVTICAFFGAKVPSLIDHESLTSLYGGIFGAGVAGFAFFAANQFAKQTRDFESEQPSWRIVLMHFASIAIMIAMTAFTAYLYFEFQWLLLIVRLSIIIGVIAIITSKIEDWTRRE